MLGLTFPEKLRSSFRLLCLGAHADDIEIGCGGTILRLLDDYTSVYARWVVLSANPQRRNEAEQSANLFLATTSGKDVTVKDFRESYFPYTGAEIKDYFESLKHEFSPDIIFTHYRHDLHQDHRLVSDLTWNTFRDHLILEYEIPKYDGDFGSPNLYVHLDQRHSAAKVKCIFDTFESQRDKPWFTRETFFSLMRLRGIESNSPGRYAEAFYSRKAVVM
jgi:LmbE family N-acetylglucosaminyl deacetylase